MFTNYFSKSFLDPPSSGAFSTLKFLISAARAPTCDFYVEPVACANDPILLTDNYLLPVISSMIGDIEIM